MEVMSSILPFVEGVMACVSSSHLAVTSVLTGKRNGLVEMCL